MFVDLADLAAEVGVNPLTAGERGAVAAGTLVIAHRTDTGQGSARWASSAPQKWSYHSGRTEVLRQEITAEIPKWRKLIEETGIRQQ